MRKSYVDDPALSAAQTVETAEQAFLAAHAGSNSDENRVRFTRAELCWEEAEDAFADVIPTTPAGAIAKLSALREMLRAAPMSESSLEIRHTEALIAFVETLVLSDRHEAPADSEFRRCA